MLKLSRRQGTLQATWFWLACAVVAYIVGVGFLAVTDQSPSKSAYGSGLDSPVSSSMYSEPHA